MNEREGWTIGSLVRKLRKDQGITQSQLGMGICSVPTINRIETGERDMDMLLASRIFQRLGYNPFKFELYGDNEEFLQYDQRITIEKGMKLGNCDEVRRGLDTYQKSWEKWINENPLQRQFVYKVQGYLAIQDGDVQAGIEKLEQAILITVPEYRENWFETSILGEEELELITMLADANEQLGEKKAAYDARVKIIKYIEYKQMKKDQIVKLFTSIVCKLAPDLIEQGKAQICLDACNRGLEVLSSRKRLYNWPDLLYWKAMSLECLSKENDIELQTVINVWTKAYYIADLFGSKEKAREIAKHLKEEFGWECIE